MWCRKRSRSEGALLLQFYVAFGGIDELGFDEVVGRAAHVGVHVESLFATFEVFSDDGDLFEVHAVLEIGEPIDAIGCAKFVIQQGQPSISEPGVVNEIGLGTFGENAVDGFTLDLFFGINAEFARF